MEYRKLRLFTIFIFIAVILWMVYNSFVNGQEINIPILLLAVYSIIKQAHLVYKGE